MIILKPDQTRSSGFLVKLTQCQPQWWQLIRIDHIASISPIISQISPSVTSSSLNASSSIRCHHLITNRPISLNLNSIQLENELLSAKLKIAEMQEMLSQKEIEINDMKLEMKKVQRSLLQFKNQT